VKRVQIDSPKDNSIERVRHEDVLAEEGSVSLMNQ